MKKKYYENAGLILLGISVACLILISLRGEFMDLKEQSVKIDSIDKSIVFYLVNSCPLHLTDEWLNAMWEDMKSEYGVPKQIVWDSFYLYGRFSDGMRHMYFCRFCWFKCREEPLAFYMRYLSGDQNAFHMYDLASGYDTATFKTDRISDEEYFAVLETVKEEIEKYNKKNNRNDDQSIDKLNEYIANAKKRLTILPKTKNVN
jgi:hypothetical protein